MSVCLVVLQFEVVENFPLLSHLSYQAPSRKPLEGGPVLKDSGRVVSDTEFAIHRGRRQPSVITIVSLDQTNIEKEMAAVGEFMERKESSEDQCDGAESVVFKSSSYGGASRSSKETTPAPGSSKESTPGVGDDYGRRMIGFKESLHFLSGNPTVDVTRGILHLFKENLKTSLDDEEARSEMLCMLSVPASMNTHDLLQFIAPCYPAIQHLRIIRNANPNQYMVLMKFRSQEDADLFFSTFNGQTFNSIEPDICKLVYVAKVESTNEIENCGFPIPGHTELPTCPVCLERMDESVDGILTILCNHTFHGECLAKWGDSSCPVCRYSQTPEEVADQHCLICGSTDSLWICLLCGHVGCGRYAGGHAHRHFMETNHLFSLQVGNNRVWDYVRDNYVHRLLQSEGDGKVVALERDSSTPATKEQLLAGEEKLNSLQLEYTHLLSSQLESQREYFEARISEARVEARREAEENLKQAQKKLAQDAKMSDEIASLKKEKQMVDKKLQTTLQKLTKVTNELETEKHLNLNLREGKMELKSKMETLQKTANEKAQQIKELESQLNDIMAHLEVAGKIENDPELQGGAIAVGQSKATGTRRKRK